MGNAANMSPLKSDIQLAVALTVTQQSKLGPHVYSHKDSADTQLIVSAELESSCIVTKTRSATAVITNKWQHEDLRDKGAIEYMLDVVPRGRTVEVGRNACAKWNDPLHCAGWQLVQRKTEVCVGDVFKLSLHILKVADIRLDRTNQVQSSAEELCSAQVINPPADSLCRICYDGASSEDNPILHPCKCQGSMQYIHMECLRQWIVKSCGYSSTSTGLRVKKGSLMCSVCKQQYSSGLFKRRSGLADIFLEDKVELPYIKLEVLSQNKQDSNYIIVESFGKLHSLRIGRSSECQIRMGLDHLSRKHSQLTFENGKVFIEDAGSSFGTLKFLRQPILLTIENPSFTLQLDNQLISLTAQTNKRKIIKIKKLSKKHHQETKNIDSFPQLEGIFGVDVNKDLRAYNTHLNTIGPFAPNSNARVLTRNLTPAIPQR